MVGPVDQVDQAQRDDTKQNDWSRVGERLDKNGNLLSEISTRTKSIRSDVQSLNASLSEAPKKATPLEKLIGIGSVLVVSVSVLVLGGGFVVFSQLVRFLAGLPNASAASSPSSGRTMLLASEQLTMNQPDSPISSLGWAAGLGYSAFAIGVAMVGVGVLVVFARVGRDDM